MADQQSPPEGITATLPDPRIQDPEIVALRRLQEQKERDAAAKLANMAAEEQARKMDLLSLMGASEAFKVPYPYLHTVTKLSGNKAQLARILDKAVQDSAPWDAIRYDEATKSWQRLGDEANLDTIRHYLDETDRLYAKNPRVPAA